MPPRGRPKKKQVTIETALTRVKLASSQPEAPAVRQSKRGRKRGRKRARPALSGSDDDDEDVVIQSSRSKRQAISSSKTKPETPPRRPQRRLNKQVGSKGDHNEKQDDEIVTPVTRRQGKQPHRALTSRADEEETEDEDSEDIIAPSTRRRGKKKPFASEGKDSRHVNDSDQDLDASPAPVPRSARKRNKGKSRQQKQLEVLRRRRRGENIDIDNISSSGEESEAKGIYDSSDLDALSDFPDEEDEGEETRQSKKTTQKTKASAQNRGREESPVKDDVDVESKDSEDENISDFIDDDGPDLLGAPDLDSQIPLEFRTAQYKAKDWFKLVITGILHRKLGGHPKQEIFTKAWQKLDDEVRGLAQSKFTSSIWKPKFARTLAARPHMLSDRLSKGSAELFDTCQACGMSRHPAAFSVIFYGQPYDRDTLQDLDINEDLEDSDTEDSEEADELPEFDGDGLEIAPKGEEFFLGAVCHSNAEIRHKLTHWRHALQEWATDQLEDRAYMTSERMKQRKKMKEDKRIQTIDDIADEWNRIGVISALYRDFKGLQDQARKQSTSLRRERK